MRHFLWFLEHFMYTFIFSPPFSVANIYCNFTCQEVHNHIPRTCERNSPVDALVRDLSTKTKKLLKKRAKAEPHHKKPPNKPVFIGHCISCLLLLLFLTISPSSQSSAWFQHTSGMGVVHMTLSNDNNYMKSKNCEAETERQKKG